MIGSKQLLRWLPAESTSSESREWEATLHRISTLGEGSMVGLYLSVSVPRGAFHISKHHYFQEIPSMHDRVPRKEREWKEKWQEGGFSGERLVWSLSLFKVTACHENTWEALESEARESRGQIFKKQAGNERLKKAGSQRLDSQPEPEETAAVTGNR